MRLLSCLAILAVALPAAARADVAVPMPPANRVALTDVIVVGRVVALEDKDVEAPPTAGGGMAKYRVAVVTVTERVYGLKDAKTIRVGFIPAVKRDPALGRPFFGNPQLEVGADGLFYLGKHFKEEFYVTPMFYDFVGRAHPNFEKELRDTRDAAKLLNDPLESLRADNPEVRLATAALLVAKYRSTRLPTAKKEALDVEESRMILKAILDAKWDAPQVFGKAHPWPTFLALGLTPKEGWMLPAGGKGVSEYHQAAREWLEKNWKSHRLERNVYVGGK